MRMCVDSSCVRDRMTSLVLSVALNNCCTHWSAQCNYETFDHLHKAPWSLKIEILIIALLRLRFEVFLVNFHILLPCLVAIRRCVCHVHVYLSVVVDIFTRNDRYLWPEKHTTPYLLYPRPQVNFVKYQVNNCLAICPSPPAGATNAPWTCVPLPAPLPRRSLDDTTHGQ